MVAPSAARGWVLVMSSAVLAVYRPASQSLVNEDGYHLLESWVLDRNDNHDSP